MRCKICDHNQCKILFSKKGKDLNLYYIVKCKSCGVIQTYPQPEEIKHLYQKEYFETRTDRGYNNYLSEKLKNQLIKVWELNLNDLNFYQYENKIFQREPKPKLLEIGCAAGYFLEYMKNRHWEVMGVEISEEMCEFAQKQFHINVINIDFLSLNFDYKSNFNCIVLWASIEHFKDPISVFKKVYDLLKDKGIFIFSTCRWGILAKIQKEKWRFMNVPEHLFFFNEKQLTNILHEIGFKKVSMITYGSGLTAKPDMNFFYKLSKTILDKVVKLINQGDMLAMMFIKEK